MYYEIKQPHTYILNLSNNCLEFKITLYFPMVLFMNISNNSHDRFMKLGTTGLPASFRFTDWVTPLFRHTVKTRFFKNGPGENPLTLLCWSPVWTRETLCDKTLCWSFKSSGKCPWLYFQIFFSQADLLHKQSPHQSYTLFSTWDVVFSLLIYENMKAPKIKTANFSTAFQISGFILISCLLEDSDTKRQKWLKLPSFPRLF